VRLCYLIGYPVDHSLSAVMHNTAFQELSLGFRYELRSVSPETLEAFVSHDLKATEVRGANVTIPYKVSLVKHMDEVDALAARIGAVNTVVNDDGWLKGYNTDGLGALRALEEAFGDLHGAKVVILGAGGAAKAIGYHLSIVARELIILNRTLSNASELVEGIARYSECRASLSAHLLNRGCLKEVLKDADIVINATPLGMSPNVGETPISSDLLRPGFLVFDIVYNPMRTRLLKEAEKAGAKTLDGVSMLVYQGVESFKIWTGREAPEDLMRRAAVKALGADLG